MAGTSRKGVPNATVSPCTVQETRRRSHIVRGNCRVCLCGPKRQEQHQQTRKPDQEEGVQLLHNGKQNNGGSNCNGRRNHNDKPREYDKFYYPSNISTTFALAIPSSANTTDNTNKNGTHSSSSSSPPPQETLARASRDGKNDKKPPHLGMSSWNESVIVVQIRPLLILRSCRSNNNTKRVFFFFLISSSSC